MRNPKPTTMFLGCCAAMAAVAVCLSVFPNGAVTSAKAAEVAVAAARPWNFEHDIQPVLSRLGCNTSGCHGKAEGQNGFKLSVFGFDPAADYAAIVKEGRGRRVSPAAAEHSLLLLKATGQVPHGGGARLDPARPEYARLRDWIAAGMPLGGPNDPKLVRIEITPREERMRMGQSIPLRVMAAWSDGRVEDVTRLALYQTNNEALARVDDEGVVTAGDLPGAVAVMATHLGQVAVFQALIPRESPLDQAAEQELARLREQGGFIDALVAQRLAKLHVAPSGPCDDATFLRRVYLDLWETLPTAQQARAFLADEREDRRRQLVEALLQRPEFADFWAMKWADLLRVNRRSLGRKGAQAYHQWIRDSFSRNKPLDQFAAELLTAAGPLSETPQGYFFKAVSNPHDLANTVSQSLLGVRIECARCHHHPWDRWGQGDYFGMQAYFTQVAFKPAPASEALTASGDAQSRHPRTGEVIFARPLGAPVPETSPPGDRRRQLADWLTAPDNPWFARNLANRAWAHFLGRGLVEPVDDFRSTNPPSNGELLDALAGYLVEQEFDFRALVRMIVLSQTYQRSSVPTKANANDEQNYSRYPLKRLEAEVLLDAVCQTAGVSEKFAGAPAGSRAIQLWDSHTPHYFLELFGRPVRETSCQCERVTEPTVAQVLHVLNSPELHDKLRRDDGRLARLCRENLDDAELTEELYLTFFSRPPAPEEREAVLAYLAKARERREAAEDVAWSLMNSLEFLFNH